MTALAAEEVAPARPASAASVPARPVSGDLSARLRSYGPFDAELCMNCGTCTATCPLGIDVLPRQVLRHALLGLTDRVREESDVIFSCLLCHLCDASCPAGVHIADDVRLLRRFLNEEGG